MRKIIVLFVIAGVTSASGQGTLIGPVTRNGSFEDGVASPWSLGVGGDVAQNPAFASRSDWFAVISRTANFTSVRSDSYQNFLPGFPGSNLVFSLSFDARIGTTGFDSVAGYVAASNRDGTFLSPTVISISTPPLVPSGWVNYQYQFQLPGIWDGVGNLRLDITFNKNGAMAGTTYFGYLDNIMLQQIPEPTSLALRRDHRCHPVHPAADARAAAICKRAIVGGLGRTGGLKG